MVDDRYTGFNKIVKARIHIYTILRPIDLEINADKSRVTLNYTFEVKDDEKEKYSDYYLEDNYHSERDGMYRIYL